jgi:perosamine synthetase
MRDFIPQIEPWINETELHYLRQVIDSTYVTEHDMTKLFESMTKELTGSSYAVATANGTAALFCCLKALDVGPGDEVIVPNITFIASSNAVIMAGATPVLCEVNDKNFCIDTNKIEALITDKTKAIMPVHLYGQSCDMDEILRISLKNDLFIVEDAAQGVGVKYKRKHTGTFGHLGVLSFYGNKTITCGEGGIILTESKELRDKVYQLKNHGRLEKGQFIHETIGYNFCFTEMQAAVGVSQLKKLSMIKFRKREIYQNYMDAFSGISDKLKPVWVDEKCDPVWWFTSFLTESKAELKEYLLSFGIQSRDFFYPLHKQPCYEGMGFDRSDYSLSEEIYGQGISLPSAFNLSNEEQDFIINKTLEFYK